MLNNTPKVSVITRTKDRPTFLKRAVESVSNQTFTDYEHIIVNDCGDVQQLNIIIDGLTDTQKSKIQLLNRKKESVGPDTIFNESIDASDADYIAIHDDDDTWHPEFLEQAVRQIDSNSSIAGVVTRTQKVIEKINTKDNYIKTIKIIPWQDHVKEISLYRQCAENQLTPISFLFRRSAYERVGKFDNSLPVVGDWEFGIRLLLKYDIDFIDPGYALANYHHREHANNTEGNTSFSGNDKHRYYTNLVRNKYLREELNSGKIGVGYIMNNLNYEERRLSRFAYRILPNSLAQVLKRRAQD